MKKHCLLLILLTLLPVQLFAQQLHDYNRQGDDAMKRKDYREARMWYEEGLLQCDMYSIEQLIHLWQIDEEQRPSMRSLAIKCQDCLNVKATENDSIAIKQLIIYYTKGVGGSKSDELVAYWEDRLDELRNPVLHVTQAKVSVPRDPMDFFIGYAFSSEMPYGLTFGGIRKNMGWYIQFKSNFSFQDHTYECKLNGEQSEIVKPLSGKAYQVNAERSNRTSSLAGTAGFIYKFNSWFNASVGAGYGERTLFSPFIITDKTSGEKEDIWCKNQTYSYSGLLLEVHTSFQYDRFFLSVGAHTMNFDYVDINAGIGLFF